MVGELIIICVMALTVVLGKYALEEGQRIEQEKRNKRK